jgi:hypothetical protein
MYYSYVKIEYVATSFSPARTDLAVKLLTQVPQNHQCHLGCYLSTQFVVYLETIQAGYQWKFRSLFCKCLISIPALRTFFEKHFIITKTRHTDLLTSKFQRGLPPLDNRSATDDRPTSGDARGKMPAYNHCQNNHQINFRRHSMLVHLCL